MHPDLDLNFITTAVSLTASDQKIDFKIIGTLVSILLRSTALHTKNQCFDLKAHLKHTFDIVYNIYTTDITQTHVYEFQNVLNINQLTVLTPLPAR